MSSTGKGFAVFPSGINTMVEAIGEPSLYQYVASEFSDALRKRIEVGRPIRWPELPFYLHWTMATDDEFAKAAAEVLARSAVEQSALSRAVDAEVKWRGAMLRLRDEAVWVEGGGFHLLVAYTSADRYPSYDRKARAEVKKWTVSMDKGFLDSIRMSSSAAHHTSASSKDRAGAIKSMRGMVTKFLGVTL